MKTTLRPILRITALAACAALSITASIAATPKKSAPLSSPTTPNWSTTVAVTENGSHRLGNPNAPVKLTEYVSYTCPHCAAFHKQSDPVLRLTVIPKGSVSVTVTNLLRNPIDLTIAMLTNCGDPKRFFARHSAFFGTQDKWLARLEGFNQEQQARWYQGPLVDRMRAISNDFGFYATMEGWGIDRAKADACLASQPMLDKLKAQQAEVARLGLDSTPSFTLDGETLDAHDWPSISKAITAKLAERRAGAI